MVSASALCRLYLTNVSSGCPRLDGATKTAAGCARSVSETLPREQHGFSKLRRDRAGHARSAGALLVLHSKPKARRVISIADLEDRIQITDGEDLWLGLCAYCVLAMARALAYAEGKT